MANPLGTLPPELAQEQSQISRQQQLAQMLMQQGMQAPQSQIISGRYVPPSIFQNLANLANIYVAQEKQTEAEQKQLDLAKNLRRYQQEEIGQFQEKLAQDPQSAYLFATTAYNPALQSMGVKKLTEGPQWKEITQVNEKTGNTEVYRYDANSKNPRDTMQFLGVSKPALTPSDIIKFRDEGISIPQQYLGGQGQPVNQPTNVYGANPQMTAGQPVARPQGMAQPQLAPTATPIVAPQQPNPFQAPPVPAGLTGKQARDWKLDQAKPLTGKPLDEVNGAIGYQKELNKIQDLFNKYQGPQLLDPNVRAEFKAAVRTAQLTGKEAFGLGVLNGPDLDILEQVVSDPTAFDAFLKDRGTINRLYNNQRMFTAEKIKTNYNSAQKAVPQNLREFVEIKPRELDSSQPKGGNAELQTKLRSLNIPYQPRLYDYRVNPDGSVDRKRKIL